MSDEFEDGEVLAELDDNDVMPPEDESDIGEDDDDIIIDDSSKTFHQHKEPVFAIDILAETQVVVTGGQDDLSFVWDAASDTVLASITGHKDSVVVARFSPDGKQLLTADMAGFIQVFDTTSAKLHWSHDCETDLEFALWHPVAPGVVVAGLKSGHFYMLKVGTDEMKCYIGNSGGHSGCSSGIFTPNGTNMLVGYEDGGIRFWDLKSTACVWHMDGYHGGHSQTVTGLCLASEEGLFFSCSADGSFNYASYATGGKQLWSAKPPQDSPTTDVEEAAIESLAPPSPSHPTLLALGRVSGRLEVWDTGVKRIRNWTTWGGGGAMVKVVWSRSHPVCLAANQAGRVVCYDALSGNVVRTFSGHQAGILDLALSPDESFFVTASEDATVKLFHMT